MPLDPRTPTVSLQMARNLLAQPETDPLGLADLQKYDATATQNAVNRNLPDFFRQSADLIGQYNSGAMQRQAVAEDQAAGGGGGQQTEDGTDFMPTRAGQFRDTYGTSMGDMILGQRAQAEAAQQKQVADMAARAAAVPGPELAAPSISEGPLGGILGKIKDVATEALAPVGHAVEKGFDVAGHGLEALGANTLGTAVEQVPEAAAAFKKKFGQGFEEKTGQPLNFETALSAINKYGLMDSAAKISEGAVKVVNATPLVMAERFVLDHILPDWMGDKVLAGQDMAIGMLPYLAISILNPVAGAAIGTTFALGATEDMKNLTAEYSRGHIDGKTFALGAGMDLMNILPEAAGPLLRSAAKGFASKGALAEAVKAIDDMKAETKGRPAAGVAEVVHEKGLAKSMEELDYENNLRKQGVKPNEAPAYMTPEEAAAATARDEKIAAGNEAEVVAPTGQAQVQPSAALTRVTELPQTPDQVKLGGHRLTTPAGDRLDWRVTPEGAHIQDVTVQVERQGTGTRLLDRAITDIRKENPDAVITAELNSEGGARLLARVEGATFAARDGTPLTPEEAFAAASRNEGPVATVPRPAEPTAAVAAPREPVAAAVTSPLEHDPEFAKFEAETNAGVQEHLQPLAKGAKDEVGDAITIRNGAFQALEDYGYSARGHAGLSAPMKAEVRAITDARSSYVKSLAVADLHDISTNEALPQWHREIATRELTARTQPVENAVASFQQSEPAVQQTLRDMGYEHMPSNPVEVAKVHQAMDNLGSSNSIPALQEWMTKNADLLTEPIDVGANSPFRVNGKFDFEAARNELRSQAFKSGKLNDLDGSERPVADAIGNRKSADLGNCAMKAVA
jgi:hypothetical protein